MKKSRPAILHAYVIHYPDSPEKYTFFDVTGKGDVEMQELEKEIEETCVWFVPLGRIQADRRGNTVTLPPASAKTPESKEDKRIGRHHPCYGQSADAIGVYDVICEAVNGYTDAVNVGSLQDKKVGVGFNNLQSASAIVSEVLARLTKETSVAISIVGEFTLYRLEPDGQMFASDATAELQLRISRIGSCVTAEVLSSKKPLSAI